MQEKPQILFLQETKCNSSALERIAAKVLPGGLTATVDADGASRSLAILWDAQAIRLNNIHANKNFIQEIFHIIGTNIHGLLTNVYFPQEAMHKAEILNTLSAINIDRPHRLWISGGDFNMITRLEEKRGCRNRGNQEGKPLKDFIQNNWLISLPFNNGIFTWSNKRAGMHQITSCLDIFLLSDNAIHIEGEFATSILPYTISNHWPISLQWNRPGNTIQRPFCFESFWMSHPDFNNLINSEWNNFSPSSGSKMFQFKQKLKHLKCKIKHWNHTSFGNIFQAQNALDQDMKLLQKRIIIEGRSDDLPEEEKVLEGAKVGTHEEIESEILNYFKQVHQEPHGDRSRAIEKITLNIPKIISEEHNELLLKSVYLREVETTARQLKAGKGPGPDGFTSDFFHNFWELIKREVWQVVEESRTLRWMFPGLNVTFISLVPNDDQPSTPEKYKPIDLCNIIYKIVSKVIASRLKLLLPLIISPEQSRYIEDRQIMNGIILTHEIIHSLKQSKKPGMLLKIDLSKAFDSLSWLYIKKTLTTFGFAPPWVRWVMSLLSSSFFFVLINGVPSSPFHPSR
eukprot:PITA_23692